MALPQHGIEIGIAAADPCDERLFGRGVLDRARHRLQKGATCCATGCG